MCLVSVYTMSFNSSVNTYPRNRETKDSYRTRRGTLPRCPETEGESTQVRHKSSFDFYVSTFTFDFYDGGENHGGHTPTTRSPPSMKVLSSRYQKRVEVFSADLG